MPVPFTVPITAEPQTLDEILDWHRGIVDALVDQRVSVQHAIRQGSAIAARFVAMTEGEIDAHDDAQRREFNRLTVLNLVASVEASIRIDYFRRVKGNLKDRLAIAYQKWHKTLSNRKKQLPNFDEYGILDELKTAGVMDNHIVGQYRECLRARHWVGHGRYWDKPTEVDRFDPDDVYDRTSALLRAMPA